MNANELADYLEKAFYADEDISKAATMLRQLQAENEALKAHPAVIEFHPSTKAIHKETLFVDGEVISDRMVEKPIPEVEFNVMKKALAVLEDHIERFDYETYTSVCELEPAKDVVFEIKAILRKAQEK